MRSLLPASWQKYVRNVHFHWGAWVIIIIIQLYNRALTTPISLLSCCYEARVTVIRYCLLVVIAWLWFFAHLLFVIMRNCSVPILWLKKKKKKIHQLFLFWPHLFNKSRRYFKQGPACFVSAILFQQMYLQRQRLIIQSGEITTHLDPNRELDWDNWIVEDYQIKIHWTARL